MIIVMRPHANDEAVAEVTDVLADAGLEAQITRDDTQHVVMAGSGASPDLVARLVALDSGGRSCSNGRPGTVGVQGRGASVRTDPSNTRRSALSGDAIVIEQIR